MTSKLRYLIFSALFLHEFCHTFVIPHTIECQNDVSESNLPKENELIWMTRVFKNLGKYRNFYANLLQEENQTFAVEIQELYNLVCTALTEFNIQKKHTMLFYSIWLVERTKNLEDFLISKGIQNI